MLGTYIRWITVNNALSDARLRRVTRGIRKMQVGRNKEETERMKPRRRWRRRRRRIKCVYVIVRKEMRIDGNKASRLYLAWNSRVTHVRRLACAKPNDVTLRERRVRFAGYTRVQLKRFDETKMQMVE